MSWHKTIISVQGKYNEKYSKCIFKNIFVYLFIFVFIFFFPKAVHGLDLMKLAASMFVVIEEMDPGCKMQTVCHESHSGRLCLTLGPKLWDQVKCLCSLQPQHITFFDFI